MHKHLHDIRHLKLMLRRKSVHRTEINSEAKHDGARFWRKYKRAGPCSNRVELDQNVGDQQYKEASEQLTLIDRVGP